MPATPRQAASWAQPTRSARTGSTAATGRRRHPILSQEHPLLAMRHDELGSPPWRSCRGSQWRDRQRPQHSQHVTIVADARRSRADVGSQALALHRLSPSASPNPAHAWKNDLSPRSTSRALHPPVATRKVRHTPRYADLPLCAGPKRDRCFCCVKEILTKTCVRLQVVTLSPLIPGINRHDSPRVPLITVCNSVAAA